MGVVGEMGRGFEGAGFLGEAFSTRGFTAIDGRESKEVPFSLFSP